MKDKFSSCQHGLEDPEKKRGETSLITSHAVLSSDVWWDPANIECVQDDFWERFTPNPFGVRKRRWQIFCIWLWFHDTRQSLTPPSKTTAWCGHYWILNCHRSIGVEFREPLLNSGVRRPSGNQSSYCTYQILLKKFQNYIFREFLQTMMLKESAWLYKLLRERGITLLSPISKAVSFGQ